jgi:mRNA interferase RelE/StbE
VIASGSARRSDLSPKCHDRKGVKALAGGEGFLRFRVGDYRVVYEVHDARLLVVVLKLGHRRDVYR